MKDMRSKSRGRGGNRWLSAVASPPTTSLTITAKELEFINLYFGSRAAAYHKAMEIHMSTIESIRNTYGPAVAHIAAITGATGIRELGDGGEGEMHATFFELLGEGNKFPLRGATTNAEPVWEDEDSTAFAELAEACGVEL